MILMTPYFMEPNKNDPMRAAGWTSTADREKARGGARPDIRRSSQAAWDALFQHMQPMNKIAWGRIHPGHVGPTCTSPNHVLKAVGLLGRRKGNGGKSASCPTVPFFYPVRPASGAGSRPHGPLRMSRNRQPPG